MMPDNHNKAEERFHKSLSSHNGLIPSEDFSTDDFALWIKHGSPDELEKDRLSAKTYHRMQEDLLEFEVPLEPDCEPKIEFKYIGPLHLKVRK
jgi:hypothetical protein